ncbi:MAG: M18 family aminopeptidase [Muribaculaceae bacterium]|nr:M18 family aminopeptidase [Muribaculaceae bacterium]
MTDYRDLAAFLDASPVNFWAVDTLERHLKAAGFSELDMAEEWKIVPGGKYYVTKNRSALFAFVAGERPSGAFRIIAAHSDSPGFRIKPNCEMVSDGGMVKLNTEVYGGPILYTWFDRPLSLAGRVILRSDDILHPVTRLVKFERHLLTIPHLAIHFNRAVNEGNPISRQKDMLPVLGRVDNPEKARGLVKRMVAEKLDVPEKDILDYDLSLYDTTRASIGGLNGEFICSGRIDDLSMVHAALNALLDTASTAIKDTRVMAIFDNEETGSGTKQGAASPMLDYILRRINLCMGGSEEDYMQAVARSFMISADDAHGVHPNYVEKQDPTNHPVLGGGPVIKINANCKYMTDADSAAVFASLAKEAGVPCQYFVNHSDVAGGSTLGNILTSQIPLRGVDIGAPIWAMHSVRETASLADHAYTIAVFSKFFTV